MSRISEAISRVCLREFTDALESQDFALALSWAHAWATIERSNQEGAGANA